MFRLFSEVFPTRVGMVRKDSGVEDARSSFPHPRGDGPQTTWPARPFTEFSPPAWGWSAVKLVSSAIRRVFPTHVGMVRHHEPTKQNPIRFPHARGDGPKGLTTWKTLIRFSPRTWGWSELGAGARHRIPVFPTHVGMVRTAQEPEANAIRFPHARGDGPQG